MTEPTQKMKPTMKQWKQINHKIDLMDRLAPYAWKFGEQPRTLADDVRVLMRYCTSLEQQLRQLRADFEAYRESRKGKHN